MCDIYLLQFLLQKPTVPQKGIKLVSRQVVGNFSQSAKSIFLHC